MRILQVDIRRIIVYTVGYDKSMGIGDEKPSEMGSVDEG